MSIFDEVRGDTLLKLLHLSNPNLPLGGFACSQGLEWAVKCGWVDSISKFCDWKDCLINEQLIFVDFPIIKRMYVCVHEQDIDKFCYYVRLILSFRETYELRLQEKYRGQAMLRLISQWSINLNDCWKLAIRDSGLACMTWLGYMWGVPVKFLALGYGYNMLESIVMAGLKLIPFGQKIAQEVLVQSFNSLLVAWHKSSFVTDNDLGSSFPLQAIASACHETQDSRLFRS